MTDGWPFGDLREHAYRVLLIDPPWRFSAGTKGRPQHYRRMTHAQIHALPIWRLAHPDGGRLLLWTTAPLAHHAHGSPARCAQAWSRRGFALRYSSKLPWLKTWEAEGAAPLMLFRDSWARGTGLEVVGNHEDLTIWKWGRPQSLKGNPLPSIFVEPRRQHSRKPEAVRAIIAEKLEGPRAELFARSSHPAFDTWGDQPAHFDGAAA
jgi:N6-adenosine-specific RNA methylase IME4